MMIIEAGTCAQLMAQSDGQFLEEGTTPWLQALDEAEAMGRAVVSAGERAIPKRFDDLEALLASLNWRSDDLFTEVELRPMRGAVLSVPLSDAPEMLRRLAESSAD